MLPLFLLAVVFSVLSPLYWTHVEAPSGQSLAGTYENQELYGRLVPSMHYGFTRLKANDWPLWSPQILCGVPFFANPVHGLLQPLNAVFFLSTAVQGLALHAFLGLFLMAMFLALYLRALGVAYVPAAIGGMVYAFSGASAAVMSRPELLGVLTWTPLLYWILYEHAQSVHRWWVLPGGLVIAAMLLAGAPAFAMLLVIGALVYGLARIVVRVRTQSGGWLGPVRRLCAMVVLGLVFSAVQWIPYLAWLSRLDDPLAILWQWDGAGHLPIALGELPAAILAPGTTGLPSVLYFGAIALMLIPPCLLHRNCRFEVLFFLAAAAGWIGLAVWRAGPEPGADRWLMAIYPGMVALAVLVGLGADRVLLTGRDPRSPLIWGSVILVLIAALALLLVGSAATRGPVAMATLVLLPFFILRVRWLGVLCGLAVAFLLFVDLRGASANIYQHPYAGGHHWLQDSLPALKEAEAQVLGERIFVLPASRETVLPANIGHMQPVRNAGGAYWPLTVDQARWWSAINPFLSATPPPESDATLFYPELLNYMGVRVVLGERPYAWMDQPADGARLRLRFLRTLGRLSLWLNESAYPRVRWVPHWESVAGVDEAMARLLDPTFKGRSTCVVDADSHGTDGLAESIPPGAPLENTFSEEDARAVVLREHAEELVVHVEAPQDGILVVADSYDPGWHAYVDDHSVPLMLVNGLFRGVLVPAGTHTVTLTYAPLSISLGLLVSGGGLLLSVLWVLFTVTRWAYRGLSGTTTAGAESPPQPDIPPIEEFRK